MNTIDTLLISADNALRTVFGRHQSARPHPSSGTDAPVLSEQDRQLAGALMRVNHVGEVCAQALYAAQAVTTHDPGLRAHFEEAVRDETDHLAWTERRLDELGDRTSWLNPLWYAGAFGIGLLAGRLSDRISLGFVVETERQVEQHLESHLDRLPANDTTSRVIVEQMRDDEVRHAVQAERVGGIPLPAPVRWSMRAAAKVMTTTAHYI